jgi:hypothetical protein
LSYIQRVGSGRAFYEAHGHDEKVYFSRPWVAHMLAGIQFVIGDLEADESRAENGRQELSCWYRLSATRGSPLWSHLQCASYIPGITA